MNLSDSAARLASGPSEPADPDILAAVDEIEKQVLTDDPAVGHPFSIDDIAGVDGLIESVQLDLPCLVTLTAAEFVGRLATVSAYLMLAPDVRAGALRRIRAALPDHFAVDATVHLFLARRA